MSDYVAQDNGTFPYDWHRESVGNAFDLQLGKMLSKASKTGRNARHYLGNKNVQWDRLDLSELETMDFTESEQEKFSLRPGDLLVCEGGEVGRTAMWKGEIDECYYQKAIHRLRPKSGTVEAVYMLQFMRLASTNGWFTKYTSQSSIAHLTREKLAVVPISFPPLPEQQEIARILTTVDNLIERTEALIEKYKSIKQGMMHDLFTRGVDSTGQLRPPYEDAPHLYKQSPLGWIPKEWEAGTISDYCEVHNNVRKPISSEERETMQGIYRYYGPTGVLDYINEYRVEGVFVLIGEDGDHFLKFAKQQMTILVEGKFNVNNHAHILSGKAGCSTEWIHRYFCHRDITLHITQQGAGRLKLNKAALLQLPMLVPPPSEQVQVNNRVCSLEAKMASELAQAQKLKRAKSGLMQDLLTGKVRVNVDETEESVADV